MNLTNEEWQLLSAILEYTSFEELFFSCLYDGETDKLIEKVHKIAREREMIGIIIEEGMA